MGIKSKIGEEVLRNAEILERTLSVDGEEILNDIKENANFSTKINELNRLISTLTQYINKSNSLEYIAFVGHFSSGKSSTINTLLDLWKSPSKRNTNQQPTDTAITLITHPENSDRLIGSHKKGELIVNSKEIDYAPLKDKVIIDTPGSGDPTILGEMVKDYLAMCDKIIYTFTAATPLDTNDIPILQKAYKELPFIPLKFVITRSNEFIENIDSKFSEENISQYKIDIFTSELIARLENTIPHQKFTKDSFIYIDNIHEFNTKKLKEYIFDENKAEIHEHKIRYFIETLKEIREYFYNFISEQEASLNSLVESAENNHLKFKEISSIGKEKVKEAWTECYLNLSSKQEKLASSSKDISSSIPTIQMLSETDAIKNYKSIVADRIDQSVGEILNKIYATLDKRSSHMLSELKKHARDIINSEDIGEIDIDKISVINTYSYQIKKIEFPIYLKTEITRLQTSITDEITKIQATNNEALGKILNHIKNNSYTFIEDELAEKSTSHLNQTFDNYFKHVDLYRTAILAKNGMQLAEKLKLGEAIDKLEQAVLSNSYKEQIKNDVTFKLYGDREKNKKSFLDEVQNLKKEVSDLKRKCVIDDYIISESIPEFNDDFDNEVNILYNANDVAKKISNKLKLLIMERKKEFREEIDKEKHDFHTKVKNRLFIGVSIGFIVGMLLLSYKSEFFNTSFFSSLVENELARAIIVQILVILLTTSISFLLGSYRKIHESKIIDYPKTFKSKLLDDIDTLDLSHNLLREKTSDEKLLSIVQSRITNTMRQMVNNLQQPYCEPLKKVCFFSDSSRELVEKHHLLSKKYLEQSKKIYRNIDKNIELLDVASDKIRDDAIEPSFILFKGRKLELSSLSNIIKNIEFV